MSKYRYPGPIVEPEDNDAYLIVIIVSLIITAFALSFYVGVSNANKKEVSLKITHEIVEMTRFIKENGNKEELDKTIKIVENADAKGFFSYKDYSDIAIINQNLKRNIESNKKLDSRKEVIKEVVEILKE